MMLAQANANKALEDASKSSNKTPNIESGLYPACVVGIQGVTSTYEGKVKSGYRFIFQYEDDDGTRWHIASKQFDLNFYAKSNFAKMITAWTGCANTPEAIMDILQKGKKVAEDGSIVWEKFLGAHTALMLELVPSKKDPEKKFVNLASFHPCTKKTGKIEPKADEEIPYFLGEIYNGKVEDAVYCTGMKLSEKKSDDKKSEEADKAVADKPSTADTAEDEADPDLPF